MCWNLAMRRLQLSGAARVNVPGVHSLALLPPFVLAARRCSFPKLPLPSLQTEALMRARLALVLNATSEDMQDSSSLRHAAQLCVDAEMAGV